MNIERVARNFEEQCKTAKPILEGGSGVWRCQLVEGHKGPHRFGDGSVVSRVKP